LTGSCARVTDAPINAATATAENKILFIFLTPWIGLMRFPRGIRGAPLHQFFAEWQARSPSRTGVFGDARSLTIPDPAHSEVEERFVIMGSSHRGKLVVVVHTGESTRAKDLRRNEVRKIIRKCRRNTISPPAFVASTHADMHKGRLSSCSNPTSRASFQTPKQ